LKTKTKRASHFLTFLPRLPPKFSLPLSIYPKSSHRRPLFGAQHRRSSGSGDQFRTSPPPFRDRSFFRFRRGVSHEPDTVPSSVILPVPTRCIARACHRSELCRSSSSGFPPNTSGIKALSFIFFLSHVLSN
jgi:hypothetical protein